MKIINKKFVEFSANMRKSIRSLCLRDRGSAVWEFSNYPDLDMFVCVDDNNILIGWALCNVLYNPVRIMVYVRQSMRRQGVGTKIMKSLNRKYRCHSVCPWDAKSRRFFRKHMDKYCKVTIAKGWEV